jgi:hypothetical protein
MKASSIIVNAIKARLEKQQKELLEAYKEASKDEIREAELGDWDKISDSLLSPPDVISITPSCPSSSAHR